LTTPTVVATALVVASLSVAGLFLSSIHPARQGQSGAVAPSAACGTTGARQLSRKAPRSLLSILAVLRRPQTPTDRPSTMPGFLRPGARWAARLAPLVLRHNGLPAGTPTTQSSVYVYQDYVRRSRQFAQTDYYLIPFVAGADTAGPIRCIRPFVGLWLYHVGPHGRGGGCCLDASRILDGYSGETSGAGAPGGGSVLSFVIPDGVARVTLTFSPRSQTHQSRQSPAKTPGTPAPATTSTPVGNVAVVRVPRGVIDAFQHTTVWRSSNGQITKTIR
jgi:hypothetical protein